MGSGRAAPSPLDTELNIELGEFLAAINSTKEPPCFPSRLVRARSSLSVKDGEHVPCPAHPYKQTLQGGRWRICREAQFTVEQC